MKRRKRFTPYIRRARGDEQAQKIRIAYRLAYYQDRQERTGKPFYVMVQHGFPRLAIEVGPSRREISQGPIQVQFKLKTFKQWSREIGRHARGAE